MAKPSEAEIRNLELQHKELYMQILISNRVFLGALKKALGKNKDSKEYKSMLALAKTIAKVAAGWYARQRGFEQKAKVPKVDGNLISYLMNPKYEDKLKEIAYKYIDFDKYAKDKANQYYKINGISLGIIPLIIWGIIAIAAAYTAVEIIDETNTTAEEKTELLKQTETTLKDLNITGSEAAGIISNTQAQATEGSPGVTGGLSKIILYGGLAFLGYTFITKDKPAKAAA